MGEMKNGKGTVKFFNDPKGYGFILLDDDQTEVFVHQTKIKMEGHRTLHEKQPVDLVYFKEEKGWKADSVTPDVEWAERNAKHDDHRGGGGGGHYEDRSRGYESRYGDSDGYARYDDYNRRGGGYDRGGYGSYERSGYGSGGYSSGGGGYSGGGYGGDYGGSGYRYH